MLKHAKQSQNSKKEEILQKLINKEEELQKIINKKEEKLQKLVNKEEKLQGLINKEKKLHELLNKKIKIYRCQTVYEKRIEEHNIKNSSKNEDYNTYLNVITTCKEIIQEYEKQIEEIEASLAIASGNVSEPTIKDTVNDNNLTTSETLTTVVHKNNDDQNNSLRIGMSFNLELEEALRKRKAKSEENIENTLTLVKNSHQPSLNFSLENNSPKIVAVSPKTIVTQESSEKEENKPISLQQQLCEQIAKMKNRKKMQEINASQQAHTFLTEQATLELDNNLADNQPFLLDTMSENLDDLNIRLRYLYVILEEDEVIDMARRLSSKGPFSSPRESSVSLKSEFWLDEETALREFEREEYRIARAENEAQQQNADQELIAGLLPITQQFFKSIDSHAKTNSNLNCVYESHKLGK